MGRRLREDGISMDAVRAEAMREVDCGRLRRTSEARQGSEVKGEIVLQRRDKIRLSC